MFCRAVPHTPRRGDAEITADFWAAGGSARFRNVDGSFYAFTADRCRGTATERLASPPDAWGGRAIVAWARRLAVDRSLDPEIQVEVALVLDAIYAADGRSG